MWRPAIKLGVGVGGAGYEYWKYRNKIQAPAPMPPSSASQTYGNQQVDRLLRRAHEANQNYSPVQQAENNLQGRGQALGHVAQGKLPGAQAVREGLSFAANLGEFTAFGNVRELDKTRLGTAVVTDVVHNASFTLEGVKKAAKATAAAGTVTQDKLDELQRAKRELREAGTDRLVTSASIGATVGAGLDIAAQITPHPLGKAGFKGLSIAWKTAGLVHGAEELERLAQQSKDLTSHEAGKELHRQIQAANEGRHHSALDALRQGKPR
ncbi:hypothetical protein [Chromobacterium vaccinii]|uniref:hypothetical protein n=1 Tax=Chromobacterium vaccinii TaxID=1108595 RepID=UPI0031D0CC9B